MIWPEAFAITGVAIAIDFLVYVICRWGGKNVRRDSHQRREYVG